MECMSRPIRALFIVPRFGSVNRGVEAFALELVARLDPSLFSITLLSGSHQVSVPGVSFEKGQLLVREKLTWLDRMPRLLRCLRPLGFGSASEIETLSLVQRYRKTLGKGCVRYSRSSGWHLVLSLCAQCISSSFNSQHWARRSSHERPRT